MAKLFRTYETYTEFKSEKEHPLNKICFIKDKGIIYVNGKIYSDSSKDIIASLTGTKLEVLSNYIELTTSNAVTISDFDNTFSGITKFVLVNTNETPNIISFNDTISKIGNNESITLTKGAVLSFYNYGGKWNVKFGMSDTSLYCPSLIDEQSPVGIILNTDCSISRKEYVSVKTWSDTSVDLNAALLEANYKDAPVGYQVVCPHIKKTYEKLNSIGDWAVHTYETLSNTKSISEE